MVGAAMALESPCIRFGSIWQSDVAAGAATTRLAAQAQLITEYPVRFEGEKRLLVRGDLPEDKARALAREIADYLDLPLESTLPEETEKDKAQ